jgi:hypothetical protein
MDQPDALVPNAVAEAAAGARALIDGRLGGRADEFWTGDEHRRLEHAVQKTLRGELPENPPAGPKASRDDLALGEEAVAEFERVVSERLGLDYAALPGARSQIGDVFERYAAACRAQRSSSQTRSSTATNRSVK